MFNIKPKKKYAGKPRTKTDDIRMLDKIRRQTFARHSCTFGGSCANCGLIMSGYCPLKDIK